MRRCVGEVLSEVQDGGEPPPGLRELAALSPWSLAPSHLHAGLYVFVFKPAFSSLQHRHTDIFDLVSGIQKDATKEERMKEERKREREKERERDRGRERVREKDEEEVF